jgi:hypothetical protein
MDDDKWVTELRHAEDAKDAARYRWLVENAVIEFDAPHGPVRHDGKDPASTKQPLDNAIDSATARGVPAPDGQTKPPAHADGSGE